MSITADEISRVLALLEKSSFDEVRIDEGDLHIALSRNGASLNEAAPPRPAPAAAPSALPPATAASPEAGRPASPAGVGQSGAGQGSARRPEPSVVEVPSADTDLVEIQAPIVGIFYTSPEPEAEPFVTTGQTIDAEATVGIIEVMKVFNTVPSGIAGTVVRRLVENGDFVEFGQPIFLVRPEGA